MKSAASPYERRLVRLCNGWVQHPDLREELIDRIISVWRVAGLMVM